MIRRVASRLSAGLTSSCVLYSLSYQGSSDNKPTKHRRTFVSQFEMQILMFEYINTLQLNKNWEEEKLTLDLKHA